VTDDSCDLLCLDLPRAEQLRHTRLETDRAEGAALAAKGLADPTRVMLALALRDGDELCVCDLSWIVERAENLVSHHLRVLKSCGLVDARRDGKMVMYGLTAAGRALLGVVVADAGAIA
jgi:DNA-binding transcriptional ArsR family regulator